MAEGFDELKAMMKKFMEDVAVDRAQMVSIVESIQANQKGLADLESSPKVPNPAPPPPPPRPPPPPPPSQKLQLPPLAPPAGGSAPATVECRVDLHNPYTKLRVGTRNRVNGDGILGMPQRYPEMGMSYSAPATPNFCTDPVFSKHEMIDTINHLSAVTNNSV